MTAETPVVVLTGASRGIGASAARWLAAAGADLVLTARSADALAETAAAVRAQGRQAWVFPADLATPGSGPAVIAAVLEVAGRLDVLITNAATIEPIAPVAGSDRAAWEAAYAINVFSTLEISQAAIPFLAQRDGRLIHVSTGAATSPIEGWAAYSSSKAAALMLTRVIAAEHPNLTAINYSPGVVDTAMQATIRANQAHMAPARAAFFQRLKDEEQLQPPDAAGRALAWLALRAPHALTGTMVGTQDAIIQAGIRELFES